MLWSINSSFSCQENTKGPQRVSFLSAFYSVPVHKALYSNNLCLCENLNLFLKKIEVSNTMDYHGTMEKEITLNDLFV